MVGLSVGSSFAVSAADEERWFEVEVILFERNIDPAKVIEHWDQSLYPTYSQENKNPMALFINNDNLINPNGTDNSNDQTLTNNANGVQPTLIDGNDTLPVFGSDLENTVQDTDNNTDIISATSVVIDGANLKEELKDPALQIVPASELQLSEQFTALNNHANYNVVLHSAWRMQPKTRKDAVPIRLFAGHNYQQQYKQNGKAIIQKTLATTLPTVNEGGIEASTASFNGTNIIDLDNATSIDNGVVIQATEVPAVQDVITQPEVQVPLSEPVWKIDGELTIYLEHYLYAKTNLFVRKEGTKATSITEAEAVESITEETAPNVEKIDLLERLGIHLEPKQTGHIEIPLNSESEAENFVIDEVVAEQELAKDELVESKKSVVPFLNSYPMQQLRVIRSGEIHYLDHPMFGMLIQIRKYEPPVQEETIAEVTQ